MRSEALYLLSSESRVLMVRTVRGAKKLERVLINSAKFASLLGLCAFWVLVFSMAGFGSLAIILPMLGLLSLLVFERQRLILLYARLTSPAICVVGTSALLYLLPSADTPFLETAHLWARVVCAVSWVFAVSRIVDIRAFRRTGRSS